MPTGPEQPAGPQTPVDSIEPAPDCGHDGKVAVPAATLKGTVAAIRAAGYELDGELWGLAADCTQCHAGCTDSPTR